MILELFKIQTTCTSPASGFDEIFLSAASLHTSPASEFDEVFLSAAFFVSFSGHPLPYLSKDNAEGKEKSFVIE